MPTSTTLAARLITLQSKKETAWGETYTPSSATSRWMGVVPLPQFTPYFKATPFDEQRGTLAPSYLASILQKGGEWNLSQLATYEDILYGLSAGMGVVSPTGAGPYTWTFVNPLVSSWNAQSFTFEYGYDLGTIYALGCLVNKWTLKGDVSKEWDLSLSGFYKTHTINGTLTAALPNRTVEVILTPTTTVSFDPAGTTPGTSAATYVNTLLTFSLDVDTGLKPVHTAGSLEPTSFVYEKYMPTLTLDVLYTAGVKAFLTSLLDTGASTVVQLKSTSGTKSIEIDFSGVLSDNYTVYGNKDGAQFVQFKLTSIYDSVLAYYQKIVVVNAVASLT